MFELIFHKISHYIYLTANYRYNIFFSRTLKLIIMNTFYEIPLKEAITWTKNWRKQKEKHGKKKNDYVRAFRIDLAELDEIRKEKGTDHIRIYFGIEEKDGEEREKLVLVGVDENDNDIIDIKSLTKSATSGTFDFSKPCPPTCSEDNVLNGDETVS